MLAIKLAFRNLLGRGLQTWLNVIVLSIAFFTIIFLKGIYEGMGEQTMQAMVDTEIGGGQFWVASYDPFDPFKIEDSHAKLSEPLKKLVKQGKATPVLISSGAIFPEGRMQSALLKGIYPRQKITNLPTHCLEEIESDAIPGFIGTRMAESTKLKVGDYVTARWRDANGTFDAADIQIVHIMNTIVGSVDNHQIWIPLERLREMLEMPGEATLITLKKGITEVPDADGEWVYRSLDYLLKDLHEMVRMKQSGGFFLWGMLLGMALLAIFNTQVLAVFRRRKEIGTLIALGMTRTTVIGLFTLEGALHSLLALIIGAAYGIPLLYMFTKKGMTLPEATSDFGYAMPKVLYPSYTLGLVVGTALLVLISVTIVSFIPTRKITGLKPTDALSGRLS
ncbi:MAG: ABC transporter permease [Calditrichaeota bacterium]|nr:ABC transporter permease [Calditrichota bacterium]